MNIKLVRTITDDNVELQGLLCSVTPRRTKAVIHLHGIWGNFYENPFIDHFIDFYPKQGFTFLSANTRDHDGGAYNANFEQCLSDIEAWIRFLVELGYTQILIQGHSLGALKAVYYWNNALHADIRSKIKGMIFLSPFDNIPFYSSGSDEKFKAHIREVSQINDKDPSAMVPGHIFNYWMLSARTYLELNQAGGKVDVFPFRKGDLVGSPSSSLGVPCLAAVGGKDFAAYPSPEKEVELLAKLPNITSVLIPNAPHNFHGYEDNLLHEIKIWLKTR